MKMEHVLRAPFDGIIDHISHLMILETIVPDGHVLIVLKAQSSA